MHSHPYHPEFASGAGVVKLATATEAAGFDGFGFTDHPAPTQRWLDAGGHDALDPFVALAFAAAHTSTIRLIPNIVVLPYRNPFVVAKSGATLDRLSDGRFTLAVGVGYLRKEFTALGVDYEERAELFDEALEVIDAIWTGDDVSFEGKHFSAVGITAHPRPVSNPRPPIWIGGNTGSARQRVVDRGEGWCPFAAPKALARTAKTAAMDSVEALATAIGDLRRRCDAAGRDWTMLDIAFTNFEGGNAGQDDFNADAHIAGLKALEALGVTWVHVHLPGDSVEHALEAIDRFRVEVIDVI
jgi:probable F420-dependent oxidoreductase